MTNLFLPLGLDASESAIAIFIKSHQLHAEIDLAAAPYWTEAQPRFPTEQIKADAAWNTVVDQLNKSLHKAAVRQQPLIQRLPRKFRSTTAGPFPMHNHPHNGDQRTGR